MRGMNRVFQGAATVDSILRDDTIELAAAAGLRSIFVGFETLSNSSLQGAGKKQNLGRDYQAVIRRLDDLGIMINGSFVFGLDGENPDVFARTVDWAVASGITTATFHIATPYPGTQLYSEMAAQNRMTTSNWDLYDTRHVVFRPIGITPEALKTGYDWAYGVLPLGQHLHGRARASIVQTFTEASRLQRRLEEVRAGVGLRDSTQAAVADAANARSGAGAGRGPFDSVRGNADLAQDRQDPRA